MSLDFSGASKLQTRDGREVRIYATDGGGCKPVHGAVFYNGRWQQRDWYIDGKFTNSANSDICDLMPKPKQVTGWINIYRDHAVYDTKEHAAENSVHGCIGQIYIDAEVQT